MERSRPRRRRARRRSSSPGSAPSRRGSRPVARTELLDKATRVRFESEIDAALKRRPAAEAKLAGAVRADRGPQPRAPGVARGGHGGAHPAWRAPARALCVRAPGAGRGAGPAGRGPLAPGAVGRRGRGSGRAERGVLLARPRALAAPRQGRGESPVAPRVRGRARARGARRVQRRAPRAARADDQGEPPHLDVRRALRAPRARDAGRQARGAGALRASRRRAPPRSLARAGRGGRARGRPHAARRGPGPRRVRPVELASGVVARRVGSVGDRRARSAASAPPPPPTTRPTLELIARLSDRPSADRDTTFLFRMARAGAPSARPMLETLVQRLCRWPTRRASGPRCTSRAIEAATTCAARSPRPPSAASAKSFAAWPRPRSGTRRRPARARARRACGRKRATSPRSSCRRASSRTRPGARSSAPPPRATRTGQSVLTETPFRWIQWGWLE